MMKLEYVPVNKLTPKSKGYKIKVTLKEKSHAKTLQGKKTFQKLVFEDLKGNQIRGTLFGEELDHFKNVLEHRKEYIIADAPVRHTHLMYREREGEYQLSFGGQTAIQLVHPNTGPVLPNYTPIVKVPPISSKDDRYDILGVVVFMEGVQRRRSTYDYDFNVHDIVIVD